MNDPQVAILLVVDNPKGVKYGSLTAAPGAQKILAETLRYLNIEPEFTEAELASLKKNTVIVPNLTGESVENAAGILGGIFLNTTTSPLLQSAEEKMVSDQYPKPGEQVQRGTTVYLYWD